VASPSGTHRTGFVFFSWLLLLLTGRTILVAIFRNLGSIDINNLKNLKDKTNEREFSFTLLLALFRFLFNIFFGKSIGKSASDLGTLQLWFLYRDCLFL
jgi:hypothetical protein